MDIQTKEITFYPNKIKTFILLLICVLFTWSSISLTVTNVDWLGTIFFGLGSVVFGISLLPKSNYLRLTKEGFIIKTLFRKHFLKWEEVKDFDVIYIHLNKMIVFNYTSEYKHQKIARSFLARLKGVEGGLPDTYGKNAYELAKILNEWNLKFSNR